jgi:DNA-binding CsgD family transcriptional regulator
MIGNLENFICSSRSALTAQDLRDLYLVAVEAKGYQNAVYAKARNRSIVDMPWMRFPKDYANTYVANRWDAIDPVMQFVHCARRPFAWTEVCENRKLSAAQKAFIENCRDLGVHSGVTIPLHGPGTDVDLISLSLRDEKEPAPEQLPALYGLTYQYKLRLSELNREELSPTSDLTSKEIECLRWCKEGKTNWEIGEILGISEKTVEFHVSNTIRKLGVNNRITAVVKGIQCGLISL